LRGRNDSDRDDPCNWILGSRHNNYFGVPWEEQEMMYNITTQAGKDLWIKMNMEFGSSVWGPVGEGIVAIEEEMRQRSAEERGNEKEI